MSTHSDRAMARRLEKLEAENEELREKNAYLVSVLVPPLHYEFALGLSRSLDKVLRVIASREYATSAMIHAALDWDKPEPLESRSAQVYVSKLRRKLAPYGIDIKNRHGVGYYIEPEAKEALRRLGRREAE